MKIDPKVAAWLNLAYAVLTAISTGTLTLTGVLSAKEATAVVAWAGVGSMVLNFVLHGYSAPDKGPFVK